MNRRFMGLKAFLVLLSTSIVACSGGGKSGDTASADLKPARWVSQGNDGLSFSIQDAAGKLAGVMWLKDPVSGSWVDGGDLSGSHEGDHVHWTAGIITVDARVTGSRMVGTVTYAAWGGDPESTDSFELAESAP